ncbi:MAG: LTA synthase family protein [Saprospiraceae bacterium]|nr:LTA synthase family protein [Saprospiraceae bacterium]
MSLAFKIGGLVAYLGLCWLCWRLYRWWVGLVLYSENLRSWQLAWLPVQASLLLLAIRGGLGVMPINESAVYYSPFLFNNHAATNAAWHMLHSLIETHQTENHYHFMPDEEARKSVEALYLRDPMVPKQHTWLRIPEGQRPNILFIMMESMTAQVVEELGGEKGVCPNLGRLAREGLLFDQCYSSGYRTDQGLVAVLGGFPAQPDQSIVLLEDKAAKLPSVPKMLKKEGYQTAFFYGGELTFANIGVWLRHQQFEQIISESDFYGSEVTQRWGADDRHVFQKALQHLNKIHQPFFANILTLSLHPPFDVPYESRWNGSAERDKFLHSAAFADFAIGEFFQQASQSAWFANTLFVLVADHGHYNPGGVRMDSPVSRQVPLIFTGPLIDAAWRGRRISTIGNHHDIPATILEELGLPTTDFAWSKDLLAEPTKPFAYYTNENGLGWVSEMGTGFYGFQSGQWQMYAGGLDSTANTAAKAYLQTLYNDFLKL